MMNENLTQFARVNTAELEWTPSPSAGVLRKRCFLDGAKESGAVTSVVRYVEGSAFPSHQHPEGEELFVLDGVFEDETGAYPKGMFVLNPPGSSHAPKAPEGCLLFVRLRQYDGPAVRVDTTKPDAWEAHPTFDGVSVLQLHSDDAVAYRMVRLAPGTSLPSVDLGGGEEIFVVHGEFSDENGTHPAGTWLRYPAGSAHAPRTDDGCEILVRKLAD